MQPKFKHRPLAGTAEEISMKKQKTRDVNPGFSLFYTMIQKQWPVPFNA